jgi:hypothetical protein
MSASVTQLPNSWTSAAGVEGGNAFSERRLATRLGGRDLSSRPAAGLGDAWRGGRRRTGLDMATDILRHEPLAVHTT